MRKIKILSILFTLQLLKLKKQKYPQNLDFLDKNMISGHFDFMGLVPKYFFVKIFFFKVVLQ